MRDLLEIFLSSDLDDGGAISSLKPETHGFSSISIGTAGWRQKYGLSAAALDSKVESFCEILAYARSNDINNIDTAVTYGDAESFLGSLGVQDFKVTTKIPPLRWARDRLSQQMRQAVEASLGRLRISKLECVMLHRPEQLLDGVGDALVKGLDLLKEAGLTYKVGISIYDSIVLDHISGRGFLEHLDVVQGPLNAFDMRLADSGWLEALAKRGISFEARSIFLNGLLLLPLDQLPAYFSECSQSLVEWWDFVESTGVDAVGCSVSFVATNPWVSKLVVGLNDLKQIREVIQAVNAPYRFQRPAFRAPESVADPRRWVPALTS